MLSRELKETIDIAGGKVIVSEGDIGKSYVIMKLSDYLTEKKETAQLKSKENNSLQAPFPQNKISKSNLTDIPSTAKIETEIDEIYRKEREKELDELLRAEKEEYSYETI